MDEYGLCSTSVNGILINGLSTSDLYIFNEQNNRYERFRMNSSGNIAEDLKRIFELKLAKRKKTNQPNYYGYQSDVLTNEQAVGVRVNTITLSLQTTYYTSFNYKGSDIGQQHVSDTIELEDPKDIKKYTCWFSDKASPSSFKMVILSKTQEGDEFYLVGVGKVKVSKVYNYPNDKNIVCEVIDIENKKHDVNFDSNIFYLPYDEPNSEYEVLNSSLNELLLSPFLVRHNEPNHIYNVYWNPVDEASCYHVILYKYIDIKNRNRILKLADYEIDRNTCYLSLDKLAGKDFIFKVKAEDRNGNIIAESRGIVSGLPQYFNK